MTIRIGELLVRRGAITPEQLQEALNAQLVYGGHLGTCLIERGFLEEAELGAALGEIYGVGYASAETMADIPRPVVDCLPRRVVENHRVVPLRVEAGRLHLAMIDPKDVQALDEAAFATGLRTHPWVAPEIRVFQAMERYYGIPRRLRFVALCRELDSTRPFERPALAAASPTTIRREPPKPTETTQVIGSQTGAEASVNRGLEDLGQEYGYGRSWREIAGEEDEAPAPPPASVVPGAPRAPQPVPLAVAAPAATPASPPPAVLQPLAADLERAADRMSNAADLVDLARALLDFAVAGTPRCVLWGVNDACASVWDQRGLGLDPETLRAVRLRVTEEPLLRLVAGSGCYRGPVPPEPHYRGYFDALGLDPPPEILLLPVYLNDHLVAMFYGDCGPLPAIPASTDLYRRAMVKLAYGLTLLHLKKRIRAV